MDLLETSKPYNEEENGVSRNWGKPLLFLTRIIAENGASKF